MVRSLMCQRQSARGTGGIPKVAQPKALLGTYAT